MLIWMPVCSMTAILGSRLSAPWSPLWYKVVHQATYKLQNRECARPNSRPWTQDQVSGWYAGLCGHVYIIHHQLTCLGQLAEQWGCCQTLRPYVGQVRHRLRGLTCYADGSRGGQPLTSVTYGEASNRQGEEIEELVKTHDICDITGHGGSCGV